MSFLPFLVVIMRGHRTVRERSEYSMTVLSHGSARDCRGQRSFYLKKFSVKKGTLPLRWVSSPGPFDCRSNALSSELRRFYNFSHRNLLTPIRQRMYHQILINFSKLFHSIMSIIRRVCITLRDKRTLPYRP